ncbi:MAG: OmpA family protein [Bacteroidia bacterium]|nr:MAG: OmpA family protein [Bacteroidia bacterium]
MKRLFTKILFGSLCALPFLGNAQNYLGVHSSNYAGVMGLANQPASFVDSRFKVDINLFSANFNLYQNAMSFDTKDMPKWWIKSFTTHTQWQDPDSTFSDRYLLKNYSESSKKMIGAYNNVQIDVLNFAFHINPKIAIGFGVKMRNIVNIDNIDPKLAVLAENGLEYQNLWNKELQDQHFSINQMTWAEYGINYGQVVKDDGEHFMKVGGTAKWLSGYNSAYMYTDNLNYSLKNEDTSFMLQGQFDYGYSGNIDAMMGNNSSGQSATGPASKFGLGLDLGFVYEWRPKWKDYKYDMDGKKDLWRRDEEKYKIRAGVSILDIGGMKFTKGNYSRNFSVNSTNPFDLHTFDSAESIDDFNQIIDSLTLNNPDWKADEDVSQTYFMKTPTALSLQFDYNIWKWFYVNATGMINLMPKSNATKVHIANQISVTPSFDYAWFGLGIPMSMNKYSGFKAGLATRLGPLTFGITDFRTLFAAGKVRGAEFYAGLRIPILYVHPSDVDGDKVSDKLDSCLVVPGVWEFRGCPDSDMDGIQDLRDACPQDAGLAEFKGCPDKDGDKIPDKDDACPEVAGLPEFKGCPDRDGDGIIDTQDNCPDEPGLAAFNGCPDKDGDGVPDKDDACPSDPGPQIYDGCPDTDGDGVLDYLDGCPTVHGPKENNGCPWPDTDGDGLLDKDDECPNLAGPLKNKGCPFQDTDNDGVLDKDDECPSTPGPVENKGCPKIEKEVEEILQTAFDNLEFETAKDIIKDASKPSLLELAKVLVKKPTWGLQISGHTDNVGDDQKNMILSKKRAEAVKNFMINEGIDASRLNVLYFGETMPIADNNTPEGRQKNRRVEMKIIFK